MPFPVPISAIGSVGQSDRWLEIGASASNAFASFRSRVSSPSVNHLFLGDEAPRRGTAGVDQGRATEQRSSVDACPLRPRS
jgi:hypothetical protein